MSLKDICICLCVWVPEPRFPLLYKENAQLKELHVLMHVVTLPVSNT